MCVYVEALDIYKWLHGVCVIIENSQHNIPLLLSMISHMKYVFQLDQYYGWESAKYGHGSVLSDLEDGKYSWLDTQKMMDACRHATQLHQRGDLMPPVEAPPAPTRQGKLPSKQKSRSKFQGKKK
jgi:hypothetical protein